MRREWWILKDSGSYHIRPAESSIHRYVHVISAEYVLQLEKRVEGLEKRLEESTELIHCFIRDLERGSQRLGIVQIKLNKKALQECEEVCSAKK